VRVSGPGGDPIVLVTYRDITERRKAELALQSLSGRLLEVQEAERQHLARELHDEIGQLLTYLRRFLRCDEKSSVETLRLQGERARAVVDELLEKVRSLSFDLRPADLDQLGLLPALLTLFGRYSDQTGVAVDFKHRGLEGRLAPALETGAYRVVQEALTNVARHSGAAVVTVRLWADRKILNLQIEDRGRGFDSSEAFKVLRSGGLLGLQERITLLGGKVVIDSTPGAGTSITAELPLDQPH
jgi:signal transduction histidine kinase